MESVNRCQLCGSLVELPEFSHENHGRRFYKFLLDVPRLSGASDILPVVAADDVLDRMALDGGAMLRIDGQIRSFNNRSGVGRRLIVSVFADTVETCDGEPENRAELVGAICKPPVFRRTPLGREICDLMLAVSRRYHRTDYIPCILWGRTASEVSELPTGTVLELHGRLQSRKYIKTLPDCAEERTTYEFSVMEAYQVPPDADIF